MRAKQAARHDSDFYGWTREQAAILRKMPHVDLRLDVENLAEEIEDMGRAEILKVTGLLRQTLVHLLKMAIEPNSRAIEHWFDETVSFQGDAALTITPGLRQRIELEKIWRVACNGAARLLEKRGVTVPQLPSTCPFTLDELLDEAFDPERSVLALSDAIETLRKPSP
ncbi:MAG: DUF29 domain-containing protein [Tardiphaga sp.]